MSRIAPQIAPIDNRLIIEAEERNLLAMPAPSESMQDKILAFVRTAIAVVIEASSLYTTIYLSHLLIMTSIAFIVSFLPNLTDDLLPENQPEIENSYDLTKGVVFLVIISLKFVAPHVMRLLLEYLRNRQREEMRPLLTEFLRQNAQSLSTLHQPLEEFASSQDNFLNFPYREVQDQTTPATRLCL